MEDEYEILAEFAREEMPKRGGGKRERGIQRGECYFLNIADVPIQPVKSARNLGVIFENDLRMDTYIQNICRSASYALYKIGHIRNYLDEKSTETLIHAFITCCVDQCKQPFVWPTGLTHSKTPENTKLCCQACNSHTFS